MFYALEDERGMYIHNSQKMGGRGGSVVYTDSIYNAKLTPTLRTVNRWKNRVNNFAQKSIAELQAGIIPENLKYKRRDVGSWFSKGPIIPVKIIHLTLTKTGEEPQNAV